MEIVVQKYGGSSVADTTHLWKVCQNILQTKQMGKSLVVVVSAQGKMTDNLIQEENEITQYGSAREHDVLVSVGEQITAAKLVMCLEKLGQKAISYLGFQLPILTDSHYGDANIIRIDTTKIIKALQEEKVVIVAGFQGIDAEGNITTLGRGGSDTTAIALATALKTNQCEFYKDVDGVYSTDPHQNEKAIKFDQMSYDTMLQMTQQGAKVLHHKCVELAKQNNVEILVKSTFQGESSGTIIKNL